MIITPTQKTKSQNQLLTEGQEGLRSVTRAAAEPEDLKVYPCTSVSSRKLFEIITSSQYPCSSCTTPGDLCCGAPSILLVMKHTRHYNITPANIE
jgi:hypothetical protein